MSQRLQITHGKALLHGDTWEAWEPWVPEQARHHGRVVLSTIPWMSGELGDILCSGASVCSRCLSGRCVPPSSVGRDAHLEPYTLGVSGVASGCSLLLEFLPTHTGAWLPGGLSPWHAHLYLYHRLAAWQKWNQQHLPAVCGSARIILQLPLTSQKSNTDVSLHSHKYWQVRMK